MAETTVTVYFKPACVQCTATKRALDTQGIRYEEIDLTTSDAALEYVTEDLGYSQVPSLSPTITTTGPASALTSSTLSPNRTPPSKENHHVHTTHNHRKPRR